MHTRNILLFLGLAWMASAVPAPLNINLGAYSPALVVGDGAISFGGGEAEAGGEAAGAAGGEGGEAGGEGGGEAGGEGGGEAGGEGGGEAGGEGGEGGGEEETPTEAATLSTQADTSALQGMGKQRLPKE